MVDERTPSLGLQMPHPDNRLEVDVLRLRAAITPPTADDKATPPAPAAD